jgi:hypothetical protein
MSIPAVRAALSAFISSIPHRSQNRFWWVFKQEKQPPACNSWSMTMTKYDNNMTKNEKTFG